MSRRARVEVGANSSWDPPRPAGARAGTATFRNSVLSVGDFQSAPSLASCDRQLSGQAFVLQGGLLWAINVLPGWDYMAYPYILHDLCAWHARQTNMLYSTLCRRPAKLQPDNPLFITRWKILAFNISSAAVCLNLNPVLPTCHALNNIRLCTVVVQEVLRHTVHHLVKVISVSIAPFVRMPFSSNPTKSSASTHPSPSTAIYLPLCATSSG